MGFTPKRTVYLLEFEDPDLAGLEVRALSAELGRFLDLVNLAALGQGDPAVEDIRAVGDLLLGFADVLVSWNVEDESGEPVPADVDGLRSLEFPFVFTIIRAWIEATAGVSAPLGGPSSGGEPLAVESLPMEPLSVSRAS